MTSSVAMNVYFLHCQNLPFLRYILCNFCLNPHISHGDMKENVSGCFFLNTVYDTSAKNLVYKWIEFFTEYVTSCGKQHMLVGHLNLPHI